jgi:hypothetical protein
MFGRKRRKRGSGGSSGSSVLEGAGEVAEGCSGCGIDLVIGLTVIAGVPLLLWSTM